MRGARLLSILVALGATLLGGGAVSASGHLVRITSTLEPATITIAPGDRITWRNDDNDRHRIRSTSGPTEFDSGNLEPGQTFRVTLKRPGRYEYYDHRNDEQARYYGRVIVKDGGSSDPDEPGTSDPGTPDAGSPPRATIAIGDRVFRPRNVTIAAGGSVTWRNDDDREHTATAARGGFDTGVLSPGESARESFPSPGTFSFLCAIHPEMTGTVTVTGSGGGAPPPAPPAPKPTPRPAEPGPGEPQAGGNRVVIRDFEFAPTQLTVDAGDLVTFANRGAAPHTVTASDGTFDSGVISPDTSWDHAFPSAGTYAFICSFHPQMAATIRVRGPSGAPPSAAAPTDGPGETAAPAFTAAPPSPASLPSAAPTEMPAAIPAAGGAGDADGSAGGAAGQSDAAARSRDIGAVLIGVAVGGALLLLVGAGMAVTREPRSTVRLEREVREGGR